ncbi:hypothetical protein A2609_01790 [Candidatus Kaiserbacteria bacterium RIFOXYD1_FULL_47_14]|uniref:Uncharacterized protein n=1 Tax=Candidatus Kaiserbacteria bacterium RIFOXYD1_FULL_47_14 TaxID=1798533 RepID=A0A1F6G5P5_9BACT|nr:MAG: hypothetical protein A2609_01790 [Candidatus Kaiserbacteria bacterium RIFOXYD1_FULL_47_14]
MQYYINFLSEVLKYLGLLAIPILVWNIYLYVHQTRENRLLAKRDLTLKKIELSEIMSKHNVEYGDVLENCEGEIRDKMNVRVDTLTRKDKEALTRIDESQRYEIERISVEINHLAELAGEKGGYFVRVSWLDKIKSMKKFLGTLWAWFVVVGFVGLMLYSFAFSFTELIKSENVVGLGIIVFIIVVILAVGLNRAFKK